MNDPGVVVLERREVRRRGSVRVAMTARGRSEWSETAEQPHAAAREPAFGAPMVRCMKRKGPMSYDVAIVIPPIPLDDAEAWAALDGFIEEQGPRPAVFQELHDRLTARYSCMRPCQTIRSTTRSGATGRSSMTSCTAAVLGVSYSRVEEVLPFLVETAIGLGLVVFDYCSETIYRA